MSKNKNNFKTTNKNNKQKQQTKMTTPDNTNPDASNPVDQNTKAIANPATQTLFRFVSLRNPQLAKKEGNTKFIFREENYKGVFDELLLGWKPELNKSKIDYFTENVKGKDFDFRYIKRTESDIANWFGNFYISSKNLISNGSLPADEVNGLISIIKTFEKDEQKCKEVFGGLWDSVIYQVLTQEDFYIKELLTQILQTIHYAKNYEIFSAESNSKKRLAKEKEIATAKVVIPDYLFVDSAIVPTVQQNQNFTVGASAVGSQDDIKGTNADRIQDQNIENSAVAEQTYLTTESMLKRQKVALASLEKEQLEKLQKELSKTQKLYNKEYSKAYDLATQQYQKSIMPEREAYEQRLLEVEATFSEEMTEAAKKLALSRVTKPEFPDFEFEFRAERDAEYLQTKLSESALFTFAKLIADSASEEDLSARISNGSVLAENILAIGKEQYILPADENLNFEEMFETINLRLSELNEEIYQNTEVEKQKYVSVGGVLIPVTNNNESTSNVIIRDAEFCAYENVPNSGIVNIGGRMSIPSSSTFSDISYNVSNGNVVVKEGNYHNLLRTNDGVLEIRDLFDNKLSMAEFNQSNTFVMKCKIDGLDTTLTLDISNQGCNRTELISVPNDNSTNTNSSNSSFIPKGFGIKRLGIADYLKVEQSTHAYVEGEVAGIENIMAREYREKSTRRLRRSEITETTSSDTEKEQLTDTTTASRFEMQSEIAKMQQEATDVGLNVQTGYKGPGGLFSLNIGASYANHRSKEESMRQAVTQAQDITSRALDRVVTKVHQERIEKIIEEFEENNSHGFDNRKGDKHVVGVYRWVDKLMKNQVWDYGKRLMFEFAVPQPAKIHTLATASLKNGKVIEKPIDPRKSEKFTMKDYTAVSEENVFKYWLSEYNAETESIPAPTIKVTKAFAYGKDKVAEVNDSDTSAIGIQDTIKIPEGYVSTSYSISGGGKQYLKDGHSLLNINIGDLLVIMNDTSESFSRSNLFSGYTDDVAIGISTDRFYSFETVVAIICQLSDTAKKQWQQKAFNVIIEAYETALTLYNQEIAEEETKAGNIKETNANFYRQIEQDVLKHNCIAYMVDPKVLGSKLYDKENIQNFEVIKNKYLDEYASLSKFMEQAFEWNIMSYDFYPYYWGAKADWQALYQSESMDPLFRSFLQSGMARVVVTVRPGFEDAVQFYMATGRLWNGGEVPVIGDPMYLSIVDELKDIKGEEQGKPWITRIPTSLTILQAQNIGLEVTHALPFTTEDPLDFENPEEVITESNFYPSDAQMEADKSKLVENIEINNDYLQLTNNDNPHQVIAQISLEDLKVALE